MNHSDAQIAAVGQNQTYSSTFEMNFLRLTIDALWQDSDAMVEIRVALIGAGYAAWEEVYLYPDTIPLFARQLTAFSGGAREEVVLEAGSTEPNAHNWLRLRAHVIDSVGHCALQFSSIRRGAPVVAHHFDFSLPVEVAALNDMGKQLGSWSLSTGATFTFEARCDYVLS
ncbi:hypothetical protein RT97_05745 [Variovorax paradoxus]|uniref:Uncharacterized protein n=1 Tax=Variovorax paradoxus TaxID=34073 RepID=A0A0D0N1Y4_VARPD|nr:hypothetical protein [Variovorax paradoxus]KIQ35370.1 hypothetical protein RT97_05745 [Variovorax paradoxus]